MKKSIAILLSLCLAFFCGDAVVSVLDDSLIVGLGVNALTLLRGIVSLLVFGTTIVVYLMMGLTPMVPKRIFLPLVLFNPMAALAVIPLAIYHFEQLPRVALAISVCQLVVGVGVLGWVQRSWKIRWPSVSEEQLGNRVFSWANLTGFVAVNLLVLVPGVVLYLAFCASLGVSHLSGGFMALRPNALTVCARTYVRADGRIVELIPMMHVGEPGFYRRISESFQTNSVILLEGVSDRRNLLKQNLSYSKMATSLGLAEQHAHFGAGRGRPRQADVDVEQFSPETIAFLNLAIRFHSEGFNLKTVRDLSAHGQSPAELSRLWDDLLTKRNTHLLGQIHAALAEGEDVVVPWGAAHMPGLAQQIQEKGFRLLRSKEYPVLHLRSRPAGRNTPQALPN